MNINWNAKKYHNDFSFVYGCGEDVLDLITFPPVAGGGRAAAIDLGCGTGELTAKLDAMGYSVLGIDDSEEMLDTAKRNYPRLNFKKADAVDFYLDEKADVIFSNAVFHWINAAEQRKLAQNLYNRLAHNGQLVCEFGGKGCAESIHAALENSFPEYGLEYRRDFYFPTVGEYSSLLESVGFRVEAAFLFDRPTPLNGENGLENWINMFIKNPFEGVDERIKGIIIENAVSSLRSVLYKDGKWFADYVRIRVKAVKKQYEC